MNLEFADYGRILNFVANLALSGVSLWAQYAVKYQARVAQQDLTSLLEKIKRDHAGDNDAALANMAATVASKPTFDSRVFIAMVICFLGGAIASAIDMQANGTLERLVTPRESGATTSARIPFSGDH